MIKYLGSKRTLIGPIVAATRALAPTGAVADLFSGTSRVGHAFKSAGYYVKANDHMAYAHCLARYVAADAERVLARAEDTGGAYGRAAARTSQILCVRSRFFHPRTGHDAIREHAELELDPELEAVALVSLMEGADRVDSTTGVQMAYLKEWAPRALKDLELRMPRILPGAGEAHRLEARKQQPSWLPMWRT